LSAAPTFFYEWIDMSSATSVTVWDAPVRLVHWSFVVSFGVSWWSAESRVMDVHRYSGYVMLGLLIFRLYWGLFGSSTARFAQFVRGPRAVLAHLREPRERASPGHTPLGALSVVAMLFLLVTQLLVGLFVSDVDGLESGPLSYIVSFEMSRALADVHEILFNVLLGLIVLHIIAIAFYVLVRRETLIAPMVTGRTAGVTNAPSLAPWWRALPGIILAVFTVVAVARA
jgi:cytochrome b